MLLALLASVTIIDLTNQLPASIKPIDGSPRTDLNFPITIPMHPGPIQSAELRFSFTPRSTWQVENVQQANPAVALVNDRMYPWFTWRENYDFIPTERARIGSALGLNRFWEINLSPFDGVIDFAGTSGRHSVSNGYFLVSHTNFTQQELPYITGVGTRTIQFHPASRQEFQNSNIPSSHWGVMLSEMEIGFNATLSLIITY